MCRQPSLEFSLAFDVMEQSCNDKVGIFFPLTNRKKPGGEMEKWFPWSLTLQISTPTSDFLNQAFGGGCIWGKDISNNQEILFLWIPVAWAVLQLYQQSNSDTLGNGEWQRTCVCGILVSVHLPKLNAEREQLCSFVARRKDQDK